MAARHATKAEVLTLTTPAGGGASPLSALDPEPLDTIVAMTATMISLEQWGSKASYGHALLAAHFATQSLAGGAGAAAGPVASRTIDKLAVSYAVPPMSASDGQLGSTSWGQQYLAMRRTLVVAPFTGRAWP